MIYQNRKTIELKLFHDDRVNNLSGRVFNEEPPRPGKILQGSQLVLRCGSHIFICGQNLPVSHSPRMYAGSKRLFTHQFLKPF